MTTPEPALAADGNPVLSAEEIGKRFLKLLEGLESREDLSPERIRDVMGITLRVEPGTLGAVHWGPELGGVAVCFGILSCFSSLTERY